LYQKGEQLALVFFIDNHFCFFTNRESLLIIQQKVLGALGDDDEKLRYLHEVYQLTDLKLTIERLRPTINKSLKGRKISYSFERTLKEKLFTVFDIGTIVNVTKKCTSIDYGKDGKKDVYHVAPLNLDNYAPEVDFPTKEGQWRLLKQS